MRAFSSFALGLFGLLVVGCGAQVEVTPSASGVESPTGGDGDTEPSRGWPMLGRGPTHQARSLASAAPAGPTRVWDLPLGEVLRGSCVIAPDGTVYAATGSALHAISPTGELRWSAAIELPETEPPSPALGHDGTVYVRSGSGLVAFDAQGAARWRLDFAQGVLSSPTVAKDGKVHVALYGGGLVELSPAGEIERTLDDDPNGRHSTPALRPDGTLTYVEVDTFVTHVRSYDSEGQLLFDVDDVGGVYGYQGYPTVGDDGTTYVATDGALVALGPTGEVVWEVVDASDNSGPAIGADGTIYPSEGEPVMALEPSGALKWAYDGGEGARGRSVAVAADGTVCSAGDRFYRLSPTGALLGVVDLGNPVTSKLALDDDGTALFGTGDGVLHAR